MATKIEISVEYLGTAMQMYREQRNLWCAVLLAATAFELLDGHLHENESVHTIAWRAQHQMHELETGGKPSDKEVRDVLYEAKNAIKHMKDGVLDVDKDPAFEARWYIDQALICFEKLGLPETAEVWAYCDRRNAELGLQQSGAGS